MIRTECLYLASSGSKSVSSEFDRCGMNQEIEMKAWCNDMINPTICSWSDSEREFTDSSTYIRSLFRLGILVSTNRSSDEESGDVVIKCR